MDSLFLNPLIRLSLPPRFRANPVKYSCLYVSFLHPSVFSNNIARRTRRTRRRRNPTISVRLGDTGEPKQQLNLSVLRFTLGIPGFDESYLPRWIGYAFGSLLFLNHFVGSRSYTTAAQFRSEALGVSLAAFSVALPYFGKFLKGATPVDQAALPEGNKQIFIMSESLSDIQKEDLAWATYILLRNTNTMSVLISVGDALCVRGYWGAPEDVSKASELDWFERQIQQIGFSDLRDTLYFPQTSDSAFSEMLPRGTQSLLVQPVLGAPKLGLDDTQEITGGFILLASSMSYAYSDRDRAWIGAISNKFRIMRVNS
ncbi:protein COFACTOR ASSEMBLY OF COMPLEX C SUBUNIT B CCB2, chloroplastic-like isoform X2 [Macadamia integrifolia]|uniref:protein COFACTOR ASSEMBLY OF COMPLEX C SUBUNIT B CCB2, chloroplastic-like isoform X2 n=1 Tax=Macadamia integrifolia TaxID=60698 RepID=UPI001C4F95CA|nr:protein COFACTOR ASSEMBLY OF COMPLEX C SUBUNIT B CCB2, chloroplastic-like isoform X2 [Macadamia integrifolia]